MVTGIIILWLVSLVSVFPSDALHSAPEYPDIVIGGDVMLSRAVGASIKKYGIQHITTGYNPFSHIKNGSIVLLNLESPFSLPDKDKNIATFLFGANPSNGAVLQWLGTEKNFVVSLANNHIANSGFLGFQLTLDTLHAFGIAHVGLTKNAPPKFLQLQRGGRLYCIGGYSYDGSEYFDRKNKTRWYVPRLEDSVADVKKMVAAHCDERIVMLHWGREYKVAPTKQQRDLAHTLIDSGATIIVGAHSHIFGEVEQYKNAWIFYSLGNFIFDQNWGAQGCQRNMDCIVDTTGKKVVPTHRGTAIRLFYPYSQPYQKWHWSIKTGRMTAEK